jgi:hypothetical protein
LLPRFSPSMAALIKIKGQQVAERRPHHGIIVGRTPVVCDFWYCERDTRKWFPVAPRRGGKANKLCNAGAVNGEGSTNAMRGRRQGAYLTYEPCG